MYIKKLNKIIEWFITPTTPFSPQAGLRALDANTSTTPFSPGNTLPGFPLSSQYLSAKLLHFNELRPFVS